MAAITDSLILSVAHSHVVVRRRKRSKRAAPADLQSRLDQRLVLGRGTRGAVQQEQGGAAGSPASR
jgi:hypothetical protein